MWIGVDCQSVWRLVSPVEGDLAAENVLLISSIKAMRPSQEEDKTPKEGGAFSRKCVIVIDGWCWREPSAQRRGIAQSGSAPALGAGCREFESLYPDQLFAFRHAFAGLFK